MSAAHAPPHDVELLETIPVRNGEAVHTSAHLARMAASAAELGRPMDAAAIRGEVADAAMRSRGPHLIRVRLRADGTWALEPRPLLPFAHDPIRLAIDDAAMGGVPIDPVSPVVRHKTSDRRHLAAARDRWPEADDVVLVSSAGRVTETTIANLLVRTGGTWWTPSLSDGVLPGVGRALAIASGEARERSITPAELRSAEAIELVSSAHGRRRAQLVDGPRR